MNCPYCNKEMEKGYVDQTSPFIPLEWYPAKREGGILSSNKRNIKLATVKSGSLVMYHCATCRKFVIDQDEIET